MSDKIIEDKKSELNTLLVAMRKRGVSRKEYQPILKDIVILDLLSRLNTKS